MKSKTLQRLLKKQFDDQKKSRQKELLAARMSAHAGASSQQHNWINELKLNDKTGAILPILKNLILFLCNHPDWKSVLGFNEFSAQVVVRKRPYWDDVEPDAVWTDHFETLTRAWFQEQDIPANQGDVGRAIQAAARKNSFHPLRTLLDGLQPQWDGQRRIDQCLTTYLHTPDTPYARAIGPRFLISAVARIYDPGCKADHMLVLEGSQGQGKSKAVRALAVRDEWYTDRLSNPNTKDAAIETAGAWLIEIAEMHALLAATTSTTKTYITRQSERYRPPYGKHLIKHERQSIFIGTINPPGTGYLKDPTGSRRIWPVECQGTIDIEGLIRDRNQLWAEAVVRYKAGDVWWLETPELEALATAEQDARVEIDVWQEPIEQWLGDREETSVSEILEHVFGIADPLQKSQRMQNRVAKILTRLQFTRTRLRNKAKKGGREWRYWRN